MSLFSGRPVLPRIVAAAPSSTRGRGISTLNAKPKAPQRVEVRSNSTASAQPLPAGEIKAASETLTPSAASPLSALPTTVLLRSLLIATISSKPYLLLPSLSALSFLCKPRAGPLLNVDRNPVLHSILKATFYKQFCAGETPDEVRSTIRQLSGMGFQGTTMTYAKETVFDAKTKTQVGLGVKAWEAGEEEGAVRTEAGREAFCPQIEAWRKGTVETIDLLGENDYLALKPTGAGPSVTTAFSSDCPPPAQILSALDEISTRCAAKGVRILVDAESHHFLPGILRVTLDLMRKFNKDGHARIYNTYQAYLKSTPATIARHLQAASDEGFTLGLKLVRGAYIASDERSRIHDINADTDAAYNGIAQALFLASHNRESVMAAHALRQRRVKEGLPTVPVGFGQLHGMSDEVSFGLLALKKRGNEPMVYKCSTWGGLGECLAYLVRRAVENRDAVGRTGDEYRALKREVARRIRAVLGLSR
ncbi:FAD-linked oxidoreductase-like protein [Aspergillus desertorum]